MTFFRNIKKIVNLRFSELNQSKGEKPLFRVRIADRLTDWGKHPSWQVLVFGLIIIGGISVAQYLWPAVPDQAILMPRESQEEAGYPLPSSERDSYSKEDTVTPTEAVIGNAAEISSEETGNAGAKQEVIPAAALAVDWVQAVKPVAGQVGIGFGFGYDDFFDDYRLHQGIDYIAPRGTPVAAALAGTVKAIIDDELYGKTVEIDHGGDWCSVYSQVDQVAVKEGQRVTTGEKLAVVAAPSIIEANGGTHLHFELIYQGEPVDPAEYIK